MMIDTHAHLYVDEFDDDRELALARAVEAGVEAILLPAIDSQSHARMFDLCRRHPESCIPMMGLHPTSVNDNARWREDLASVEAYLQSPPEGIERFCAVGEIGLDFYWSAEFVAQQIEAFTTQLHLASRFGLPVVIHTRSAWDAMSRLVEQEACRLSEQGLPPLRGVFHAFSDEAETYRRLKACGDFVFGIGGVVTFKKSPLADVVRQMDMRDIVLETDCPYLTPSPYRGRRNEPAYVRYVCSKIAELKGLTPEEVARRTTENAKRIFNIK